MINEFKAELIGAGVNIDGLLERFMNNEALAERFLKKFADDGNYDKLIKAFGSKDEKSAFEAAHTLKGVCGNLSMEKLYSLFNRQTELLRENKYSDAEEMMPEITVEYKKIVNLLKGLV